MSNGSLYTHIQNNIATVEFYHPASNSFPSELLERLAAEFNALSINNEVHVIILKSEKEKAFCAGASFDELVAITNFEEGKEFFIGFANVINAMRKCSKLIIGRIQGKAVGGGVGLAAACDYCFATEQAAIKLSEFTIGIGPFVIAPVVERKIGVAALSELTLDATSWQNAYWAKEKGLFAKVFETHSELDNEVDILASKLASYNPEALNEMKKIVWQGTENWDILLNDRAAISGKLVLSDFTKKALQKFKK
ncbi:MULTISPECIES: enoyl-CoA hydratase/isomerase family protein [Flavobacteriaceae]|uniref:Enoyl-CoA hydratase/isomerase family protein n=2 Tax=Flavobacteriaceae TaxID=49546 RepID=A0A4Y8ARK8_9FLAO|nr:MULTISPECIES: enoyl-CoA hydratase/isomerase family protein [Flavobacteriaceae]TEW73835.1 enoyl-CoA hydratase/isomerase family protein [Gramella jeungdoensis]GGK38010.1 enoyl-CoA hydratase [Lutibacter litoralis]